MKDSSNRRPWQRAARVYAAFMKGSAPLYDEVARRCLPYLSGDMRVLELACGSGQFTFRLAGQVHGWEATDFSEKMVTEAKKRPSPPSLTFAVRDATKLPYAGGAFDAVFIGNALHIMPEPEKALAEIYRVLKPGGVLLAPTFLWGADSAFRFRARLMALAGFRVRQRWDADGLAAFVARQGFAVLERDVPSGGNLPMCCLIARKK